MLLGALQTLVAPTQNTIKLISPSFITHGIIPLEYAHTRSGGHNHSPSLRWSHAPALTQSFVIIAQTMRQNSVLTYQAPSISWVVYDIPATVHTFTKNVVIEKVGGLQGRNDCGTLGYDGPGCDADFQDSGYIFTLYALNTPCLGLPAGATPTAVHERMKTHVLASCQLIGKFSAQPNNENDER